MSVCRRAILALVGSGLIVGCAAPPAPTDTERRPSPSASVASTASPMVSSAEPLVVPDDRSATAIVDDIQLTIELDRAPLRPGVQSWVTMTVTNVGSDVVHYSTDGCGIPVYAAARLTGYWVETKPYGGVAEAFRAAALNGGRGSHLATEFRSEEFIGQDVGCADLAMPHDLSAGETLVQRALWQPFVDTPTPDVPAEVVATFPYDSRGQGAQDEGPRPVVEATLPTAVMGGETWPFLTPGQVVDRALEDPGLVAWLASSLPTDWDGPDLQLDPDAKTWTVSVYREVARGWIAELTLDARTGALIKRRFE